MARCVGDLQVVSSVKVTPMCVCVYARHLGERVLGEVLSPSELKQLIAEKRPEFAGCQQHDAQDVAFVVASVHDVVCVSHCLYRRTRLE